MLRRDIWLVAMRWIIIVTVAGVVLAFNPRSADAFGLTKTMLLALGTLLSVACAVLWHVERGAPVALPSGTPALVALVIAVGLATAASHNRTLSMFGNYSRYGGLITLVLLVVMALVTAIGFGELGRSQHLLWTMVGAAVAVAMYAVVQRLGHDLFDFRDATGVLPEFPGSTVGNSLFAGSVCGMAVPAAYALGRTASRPRQLVLGAASIILSAGLWATQSRSGMLGALCGLGVVALTSRAQPQQLFLRAVGAAVLALTILGVVTVWHPGMAAAPGPLKGRLVLRTESVTIRGGEWSAATRVWRSRPLIGTGPETFATESPRFRSAEDARRFGLRIADKPHNLYLEYLSSTGVLGLAAFVAVAAVGTRAAARRIRDGAIEERAVVAGLAAVGVSYLVAAAFSFDTPATTPWAFISLGALIAGDAAPDRDRTRARTVRRTPAPLERIDASPWFTRMWVALVVAVAATFAVQPARADLAAARALRARAAHPPEFAQASRLLGRAIALNPREAVYRAQAGELAEHWAGSLGLDARPQALRVAVARFSEAVDAQPGNVAFALGQARSQSALAAVTRDRRAFARAERFWSALSRADRRDWQLRSEHALSLNAWANAAGDDAARRTAVAELRQAVSARSDYVPAWVNLARLSDALGDQRAAARAARRALALHPDATVVAELRKLAGAPN